jgi:hypothetical protein
LPAAEEVEPWLEAIIRLWDDPTWYQEQSNRARGQAERWHPDRLRPLYADFFANVRLRSGPPVLGGALAFNCGFFRCDFSLASVGDERQHHPLPVVGYSLSLRERTVDCRIPFAERKTLSLLQTERDERVARLRL